MDLPTQEQCYALWNKYGMPENIRAHTRAVARVADAVAVAVAGQGVFVDKELVNRGALLHDIAKIIAIKDKNEIGHGMVGYDIVMKEGYSKELALIVRNHVLNVFGESLTLEEKIVNYADRRVVHDAIVTLQERMEDLKNRYQGGGFIVGRKLPLYKGFEQKHGLQLLHIK